MGKELLIEIPDPRFNIVMMAVRISAYGGKKIPENLGITLEHTAYSKKNNEFQELMEAEDDQWIISPNDPTTLTQGDQRTILCEYNGLNGKLKTLGIYDGSFHNDPDFRLSERMINKFHPSEESPKFSLIKRGKLLNQYNALIEYSYNISNEISNHISAIRNAKGTRIKDQDSLDYILRGFENIKKYDFLELLSKD